MEYDTSVSGLTAPKEKMTKEERIQELREKIARILVEPDIGCMDWNLGCSILANWKAGLPDQLLTLIKLSCYLKAERELPITRATNILDIAVYNQAQSDMLQPDSEGRVFRAVKEW